MTFWLILYDLCKAYLIIFIDKYKIRNNNFTGNKWSLWKRLVFDFSLQIKIANILF